jgi:alanine racemase
MPAMVDEMTMVDEVAPLNPDAVRADAMSPPSQVELSDGSMRVSRPRRAAPADAVRPTRAEINLANLRHNLRVLERALVASSATSGGAVTNEHRAASQSAPQRAAIWGVLKADGYGHGAPAVARTLERAKIGGLCVALLEEAIELRAAGIRLPILVMGGYFGVHRDGIEELLAHELVPVVYDASQLSRLAAVVRTERPGEQVGVHLKVDTGMARLGARASELDNLFASLAAHPEVRVDGLMTHLACADGEDASVTQEQLRRFHEAYERARAAGLNIKVRHASNSAAMLRFAEAQLDAVRPGIALFGVSPTAQGSARPLNGDLRPVMRMRSEIVSLRTLETGERVGYGHTWTAPSRSLIATVPVGYADGLSRQLSNRGHALVRGRRVRIVGAVSMDLVMLDVTEIAGVQVRDEAVFLGTQEGPLGHDAITAQEIADHTGTIPWEVLTSISRRVPRFYRDP